MEDLHLKSLQSHGITQGPNIKEMDVEINTQQQQMQSATCQVHSRGRKS